MEGPIIIFDGYCELCNQSVNLILRWERKPVLRFTANQNAPGQEILRRLGTDPDTVSTVFLLENGQLYSRSTAALRIARHMRFPLNLLYGFVIVPRFLRDAVYRWVARNRYRWWGKRDTCRIPSAEEKARFLIS